MKKFLLPAIIIILLLVIAGLSGCFGSVNESSNNIEKFVGTWRLQGSDPFFLLSDINVIAFTSDKTFTTDIEKTGSYELKDKKLALTYDNDGIVQSFNYEFSEDKQILTLVDSKENAAAYIKQ